MNTKRILSLVLVVLACVSVLALSGCGCEHEFGEWEVKKEATCSKEGVKVRICSLCEETEEKPIKMVAHTVGEWTVSVEPTCTAEGKKTAVCTVCGATSEESIEKTEHVMGEWVIVTEPTCTAVGAQEKKCTGCDYTESGEVEMTEHPFGEETVIKAATCTEDGQAEVACTTCDLKETKTIPATGHSWADATCVAPKTCTVCSATEGSAGGHNFAGGSCTEAPTCTVCGAADGVAPGHNFVDGNCSVCGAIDQAAQNAKIGASLYKVERYYKYMKSDIELLKTRVTIYKNFGDTSYLSEIVESVGDIYNNSKKIYDECKGYSTPRLKFLLDSCETMIESRPIYVGRGTSYAISAETYADKASLVIAAYESAVNSYPAS